MCNVKKGKKMYSSDCFMMYYMYSNECNYEFE